MKSLIGLTAEELVNLKPHEVFWVLIGDEILYIFKTLNGFWAYDYEAAKTGRVGLHAKLKSERCSDGFFYSKVVLQHPNLRRIIAKTLVGNFKRTGLSIPDFVAGIPDGASELGQDVAYYMGVPVLELKKENGKIIVAGDIEPRCKLLLVEDFCTKGTGFKEAEEVILDKQPGAIISPVELVILNRGGLTHIEGKSHRYMIEAAVVHRISDWDPAECPIHKMGSESIKPKVTEENWELITSSQRE